MKGRTQPRIFPTPVGAAGLMGGKRFAYDLHERLWGWWPGWEGRRKTWGSVVNPATFQHFLKREFSSTSQSYHPALAHTGPLTGDA